MISVLVNTATVIIGSLIGLLMGKAIPKKVTGAVMTALGGCCIYIGVEGALKCNNILVVILSLILGTIIGTLIDIDKYISKLGACVQAKLGSKGNSLTLGFVTGSILFCMGSMTIVGSLNAGISGDNQMIFAKSVMDLFSSMMLAAGLGMGVVFSAAFVFIFQGLIVLFSNFIAPVLSDAAIGNITCVGAIMTLFLAFNLIGVTKIKVANYLPSLVFAPIVTLIFSFVASLIN